MTAAGDDRLAAIFADAAAIDADLVELRKGKLDQVCPACGTWEAAGFYCSRCFAPTGSTTYYPKGDIAERQRRQGIAGKTVSPPATGGRGRPTAIGAHASRGARLS